MGLDQPAGDRQAETRTARAGTLDEAVEDMGQELRIDPGPVSLTVRMTLDRRDRPADGDPPARGVCRRALATRFERTSRIRTGSMSRIGRSSADADREGHARRRRARPERVQDLADQDIRIGRLGVEGERARLGEGDGAEVLDQTAP